jgi:hypothetical protein
MMTSTGPVISADSSLVRACRAQGLSGIGGLIGGMEAEFAGE